VIANEEPASFIYFIFQDASNPGNGQDSISTWLNEDILKRLCDLVDTDHNCGYVTLINLRKSKDRMGPEPVTKETGLSPKNGKMRPENASLVRKQTARWQT
jgi:hypothetical protein